MKTMQLTVGMIATNCYIVYDEETRAAVVIDPADNARSILRAVEQEGLQVKYVLLTHAHFDHLLAAHEVLAQTGAQYVVPEGDLWLLKRENMQDFGGMAQGYVEDTPAICAVEGTQLSFGGLTATYLHTPGHTPGSSVIQIGDCLFTGDTLFRHECGRCDLAGGDFGQMLDSLARLHDLPGDYTVLPGHEALSTLGEERAANPYMLQAVGRR
ncbi:MAG: MBL fold metallo-hydrolase [Eubacteriales bacterium]|nr:MBL fold metallo-hydrolase [Eubacteriales bacterium]